MKRMVKGTTGKTTSLDYVKSRLFDYLCDEYMLEVDTVPAERVATRVAGLSPIYDIDDVITLAIDEGIKFVEALRKLEEEVGMM